ncbi:MAG: hypothetical protein LBG27_11085 [Spirochaetaceae bacterium]|nr:hypothetical protein [Spirochaetaceae bacterium]
MVENHAPAISLISSGETGQFRPTKSASLDHRDWLITAPLIGQTRLSNLLHRERAPEHTCLLYYD